MRIESVRFDASGNAAIALSGGISFFLPKTRIAGFADMAAASWGLDPVGGRALVAALPEIAPEFDEDGDAFRFLYLADETARALRKAVELCARAEQSSGGLAVKLAQRGYSRAAASAALETLVGQGIVDDARYAALWARHRAERKGEGPATVAAELRARGFRSEVVKAALAGIDFSLALTKAVQSESAKIAASLRKRGRGETGEFGERFRDSLRASLKKQGFDAVQIGDEIDKLK